MPERSAAGRGRVELSPTGPPDARASKPVWNTMVVPGSKIVFVNVSKNASTSLKWLTAEISGQDPATFHQLMGFAPTRQQTIHKRSAWVGVPALSTVDQATRSAISPADGWFVFAVVRDPRVRVWSAWQSKFLVGNPRHTWHIFKDAPWLPRVPRSADDVVEDFGRFVAALEGPDGPRILDDTHFRPQTALLRESLVPYTHLYEPSGLPLLLDDLRVHLEAQGLPGEYRLSRENETPLAISGRVFTPEVLDVLERVYASDLERFGHLWDFDAVLAKDPTWSAESFLDVAGRVATGQRVADLALGGNELELRVKELERTARDDRRTVDRLTARIEELEAALERRTLRGLPRAAVSKMRWSRAPEPAQD